MYSININDYGSEVEKMRRFWCFVMVLLLILGGVASANANHGSEILFRGLPWGISRTEAASSIAGIDFISWTGESYSGCAIDEIITGKSKTFEYSDINIMDTSYLGSLLVAGYETDSVNMYYAYIPTNGVLTKTPEDSSLYAAEYTFKPENAAAAGDDLLGKLSSLYGEPSKTLFDTNLWKDEFAFTYWYGANDTMVVLIVEDEAKSTWPLGEEIKIVYAWNGGDQLLEQASEILKAEALQNESTKYGNGDVSGL